MAVAGVAMLLEKVTDIILYYDDLMAGAAYELKELENDLKSLRSLLSGSAHKSLQKQLEREMREIVYVVEDTLDTCLTESKKKRFTLRRLTRKTISMAEHVKSLREEIVKPMLKMATEALTDNDGPSSVAEQLPTIVIKDDQAIRQGKVVGLEVEEDTITSYLMEPEDKFDVISIVGMAGLGKTTLAWKVYNSERTQYEFRIRIWISVSQKFEMRDILLTILRRFINDDMSSRSDHELEEEVVVCLKEERFLIVLDDLWSVEDWRCLEPVLTKRSSRGKVLITSNSTAVGEFASRGRQYQLPFRSPAQSWELLQLEVFGDVDIYPQHLRDVGQQIAHKCNGLPLTIVVVGGILVSQFTRQRSPALIRADWVKVSQNVTRITNLDKDDHIRKVLGLSYDALPDVLRDCFLYLGVFPEDYEIPVWTLTRLWVAEGFIQKKDGESLEETAQLYLNDLINMNLLMAGRTNPMGKVKTCRIHDAVRAFCTSEAAKLDLFHEIKISEQGAFDTWRNDYRRLCIHSELTKFLSQIAQGQQRARSFLCFYRDPLNLERQYTTAIPDTFRLLRVLDSNSIRLHRFPPRLTDLIHLKYITLYVDDLKVVPEPIAGLWNLQTLVVDTSSYSLTMKANIWRMIQLRHLKTKASIVLDDKKWEGKAGDNLQTLTKLSPDSFDETVSTRASYLRKLGIRGKLANLRNPKLLGKLGRLENLKLANAVFYESEDQEQVFRLPQLDYFPPNLKTLTLSNTKLDWIDMSTTLARIKTLEVLKLKDNAFTGITWEALGHGFPRLQFLLIARADLVIWEATADHFPALNHLSLSYCENLQEIPQELATNLHTLSIAFVGSSVDDSAKHIHQIQKEQEQTQQKHKGFQLFVGPGCVITN